MDTTFGRIAGVLVVAAVILAVMFSPRTETDHSVSSRHRRGAHELVSMWIDGLKNGSPAVLAAVGFGFVIVGVAAVRITKLSDDDDDDDDERVL